MKKALLLLFCGCFISLSVNAQELTPSQLKLARNAVYEWISRYNACAMCDSRSAVDGFIELFANDTVPIYNDLFPLANYHFANPYIQVSRYASAVNEVNEFYRIQYKITGVRLVSERFIDGELHYTIELLKNIRFVQNDSYETDRYEYPFQSLRLEVQLVYQVSDGSLAATSLQPKTTVEPFVILHSKEGNSIEDYSSLERLGQDRSTALITCHPVHVPFDEKMCEMEYDTVKNYFGIGFVSSTISDDYGFRGTQVYDFDVNNSAQLGVKAVYYRQLMLDNNHRFGIEAGVGFRRFNSLLSASYTDRYEEVDPDGGQYKRIVQVDNYQEELDRLIVFVPVRARYDYCFTQRLALTAKCGFGISRDIAQSAEASGDATYSGYYDWLYGVTIDQNGIYDFGRFQLNAHTDDLGACRSTLDASLSLGLSYHLSGQWSAEAAFCYDKMIWGQLSRVDGYHLTKYDGNWKSLTYTLDEYSKHSCSIMLQINYNF